MTLRCGECGEESEAWCARCDAPAEFVLGPLRLNPGGFKNALRTRRSHTTGPWASGVWRYAELLPQIPLDDVVTLGENNVPLYRARLGGEYAGVASLSYLHLGANPTGSFKDAGMTVAVSAAKASGARAVLCASTGNTAASMAAYAARAGLEAHVLVPRGGVSAAKLAQTLDYGARIVEVDGDFDDALLRARASASSDTVLVNSVNPYRIEGQKCAAFALLEHLGWNPPDWIVVPGGNLGNASAFGKALREAHALGLIDRLPRLAVAQAAGAAPFVNLVENGGDLVPVRAQTDASAIRIGAPASWRKARRALRDTNGAAVAVDDARIADARAIVGREGIGCEPASAASLAGTRALRERGTIGANESVVAVLTGHVLKDPDYAHRYHAAHPQPHVGERVSDVARV